VPNLETHWTHSFVQLVKLRLLPNAAHANVVHQVVLVIQAEMAKMVNQAEMEMLEVQAKMLNPMITSSQYHLSATATLHQAALAKQDQKDPMDHQVMPDRMAVMVNQAHKDHQAHQAQLANQVTLDQKDLQANLVYSEMVARAHQVHKAKPEPQALQDQQVHQAAQAKMVNQAAQVVLAMLVHQVVLANQEAQVVQEKMVLQELQDLAPTAHQHVWLQVIKHWFHSNYGIAFFLMITSDFSLHKNFRVSVLYLILNLLVNDNFRKL